MKTVLVTVMILFMCSVAWGEMPLVGTIPDYETFGTVVPTPFRMQDYTIDVLRVPADDGRIHIFKPVVIEKCQRYPYAIIDPPCIEGTEKFVLEWQHIGVEAK